MYILIVLRTLTFHAKVMFILLPLNLNAVLGAPVKILVSAVDFLFKFELLPVSWSREKRLRQACGKWWVLPLKQKIVCHPGTVVIYYAETWFFYVLVTGIWCTHGKQWTFIKNEPVVRCLWYQSTASQCCSTLQRWFKVIFLEIRMFLR